MKKIPLIIIFTILTLILSGCSDVLSGKPDSKPGAKNIPQGYGALQVNVTLGNARTAVPKLKMDELSIYYSFDGGGFEPFTDDGLFILKVGNHDLKIKAMIESNLVAEGFETITIGEGTTADVTVELRPIAAGEGTLDFTVKYTDYLPVSVTTFTLFDLINTGTKYNMGGGTLPSTITLGESYTVTIPSGYYRLLVMLQDIDNNKFAHKSEIVHIYQNLTTETEYIFTYADFETDLWVTDTADSGPGTLRYAVDHADSEKVIRIMLPRDSKIELKDSLNITSNITIESENDVIITRGNTLAGDPFTGSLFTISDSRKLTLGSEDDSHADIIIDGGSKNKPTPIEAEAALINVGGQLVIYDGVILRNNNNNSGYDGGGGVYVNSGTFTMNGGTISGNEALNCGGGVYVTGGSGSLGTFIMNRGTISGNNTNYGGGVWVGQYAKFTMYGGTIGGTDTKDKNIANCNGGGVQVSRGTFTMNGENAKVLGNEAGGEEVGGQGGGVYIFEGTFNMYNGIINGNKATDDGKGGGVCVYANLGGGFATFIMEGGIIGTTNPDDPGNTATGSGYSDGGGVYVFGDHTSFTMRNYAKVCGNTANNCYDGGGGVCVIVGSFTMENNAEVFNNKVIGTESANGGGVYVSELDASFIMKNNAKVYGNSAISSSEAYGGGVYVGGKGTLTMQGNTKVSNNHAGNTTTTESYGGGVYVAWNGAFTMEKEAAESPEVSLNKANGNNSYGGGVYVNGIFRISNGTVYGQNSPSLTNTALYGKSLYKEASATAQYGSDLLDEGSLWNIYVASDPPGMNTTILVNDGDLEEISISP